MMRNPAFSYATRSVFLIFCPLFLICTHKENNPKPFRIKPVVDIDNQANVIETVVSDLEVPWSIDFLPGDTLIFTERTGKIKILENGQTKTIGKIDVVSVDESGLLGLAIDPQFSQNRFLYLYYTGKKNGNPVNRVSRFTLNDTLTNENVILDDIPASNIHDGGRIAFGPDKLLYVTTGDAGNPSSSQDLNSISGKILRMNKDGSTPSDNPFNNLVYAYGIRNSQGLAWSDDTLYATDHGPSSHDEINRIEKGGNYGWPQTCDKYPALFCYTGFTLAPAGIGIFNGTLFVSGLRGNQIRKIDLKENTQQALFTGLGRLRAVTIHNGYLYFSSSNLDGRGNPQKQDDRIYRVNLQEVERSK